MNISILHIAHLSNNLSSGLSYSIPGLVKSQRKFLGTQVELLISAKSQVIGIECKYLNEFLNKKDFVNFLIQYDLCIFHSTYVYRHIRIAKILQKYNIPYIITPHGGFSHYARSIKFIKKYIGDIFGFKDFFLGAYAFHFLSSQEQSESVFKTANDFVIPNGIEIHKIEGYKNSKDGFKIVFIGRLDIFHKGLDILLESVSLIKDFLLSQDAHLEIYGPEIRNSLAILKAKIDAYGLNNIVNIKDPVFKEKKEKILMESDIFIQTSRFEGLPMGVLEALSYGIPCILTPGTNMADEVEKYDAGIKVEFGANQISLGLVKLIKDIKGGIDYHSGALLLAEKYAWRNIANDSINKYLQIHENFKNSNYKAT